MKKLKNGKLAWRTALAFNSLALNKRAEDERRKLNKIILNSSGNIKAANEGRLRKLNERIELREQKMRQQINPQSESSDVALILVEVL